MDPMISLEQKNTLAEYMIPSGADNRPPMLDKDLYDSWKSRMELYMQNREHGRMILELVEHGPLIWPTVEENGVIRTKKYAELSAADKIQADCDMKATNIILQVRLVLDISLKDKNEAKSDKTEHEIGKSAKNQGQSLANYLIEIFVKFTYAEYTALFKAFSCLDEISKPLLNAETKSFLDRLLGIEGPPDSLIMKDEHLDTIPTTESDEVIESSVENLVPIPNDILREKLLNVNLLIANIEALKDNPTPSSDFWQSHFFSDYSLTDHGVFYFDDDHIEENSSGSTTTHSDSSLYKYDSFIFDLSIDPFPPADRSDVYHEQFADELGHIISPPEYDHFYFKIKPELGNLTMDVVDDIFDKLTREPRVQCPNLLSSHPTLYLDLITFFSSDSLSLMLYGFFFLFSRLPGFLRPLGSAVTDIHKRTKNEAKPDQTEHEIGKTRKNQAKDPVHGLYCRQCALIRKTLEEVFQDFQDTSKSSDDDTNFVNQEPFVVKQGPGVNSSQSPPQINHNCCYECGDSLDDIFCQRCTCKSCGKGAHYGYNCPPQIPIISNPEPCYNQNLNEILQNLQSLQQQCLFGTCQQCGCNEYDGVCFYCTVGNGTPINFSTPYSSNDSPNFANHPPQNFQNFQQQYPCCENCGGSHETYQCQPMNEDYYHEQNSCYDPNSFGFDQFQPPQYTINHPIFNAQNSLLNSQNKLIEQMTSICDVVGQIMQKKEEEKRIAEEQAAKARYWKIPICYDDDDDEERSIPLKDIIMSELPPCVEIIPVLLTEEPIDSLIMKDDHLDTILATESDEDFSESNDDSTSIDDDSFYIDDIEYVEASPPDSELVSLEAVESVIPEVGGIDTDIILTIKDDILCEKLLNVNLLIANIEALKDNPTPSSDSITKSSSTSPNFFLEETNTFDNSLPESKTFCFDLEEKSSGNPTSHSDYSLTDHEVFYFDDDHIEENSSGSTTTHSNSSLYKCDSFIFDLSIDPFPPADRSDVYHEQFADELGHIISPPEYDHFYFKIKPELGNLTMDVVDDIFDKLTREPRVHVPNILSTHPTLYLDLDYILSSDSLFAYVVWIFLPFLAYPVSPPYILSTGNEDTIFDPGISIYHSFMPSISHRSGTFLKFNVPDISLKDNNEAKPDKTEHEIGKSAKNEGQRYKRIENGAFNEVKTKSKSTPGYGIGKGMEKRTRNPIMIKWADP
ncbi:hypothetical protein Tco_0332516, partial [Tanacetum coccineum]